MGAESVFGDLRRLADWFSTCPQRTSVHIERVVDRLGGTAIPLLGRELRHLESRRREAARTALARLANDVLYRARVVRELRDVTEDLAITDEAKVCAVGLLSELGERAAARFTDPSAIQQRSALALAAQLSTDADLANAADLMVHQLDHADIVQMLAVMIDAAPAAALRLAGELSVRLDLPADAREQIAAVLVGRTDSTPIEPLETRSRRPPRSRATQVAVLVDASARLVVVATRPLSVNARTYRRWAVLIGAAGIIDDCLHDDDCESDGDAASLIASLVADGYRVASSELSHARTVVTAAARLTALTPTTDGASALTSSYYLGRDLLDLGDAHMGAIASRARRAASANLARALEYIGDGEVERGAQLLAHTDATASSESEHHAATAYVHLAKREPQLAAEALERAIAVEPEWPLHHWNLACALRMLGDASGCFWALRRFVATSAAPTGLYADPDQPGRVGLAERMMAELERTARITGTSLRRRRRKKPSP